MVSLSGPTATHTYAKGGLQGIIFAEFRNGEDRDTAIALLQSAGLQHGGKEVWANQHRSPAERAARNFCFGLKRMFKNEWQIPFAVKITDEAPYEVRVGGEHALTVDAIDNCYTREWHGDWKDWTELHTSPEVIELIAKCDSLVARGAKGMKGSGAKGTGKKAQ